MVSFDEKSLDDLARCFVFSAIDRIFEGVENMTGPELKKLRKRLGLSLSKAAKILDVNQRTVARWEASENKVPIWVPVLLKAK